MIADDHALFRAGMRTSLSAKKDIELIGEADNGMQLLELLKHITPDIILLDITMPIMDGIQTLPVIRKRNPNIKVIIVSMHNDYSMISTLMELGANSYLTKNSDSETIYQAIRTCFEQGFYFNELTNKAQLTGLGIKKTNISQDKIILSKNETLVLKLICDEKTTKEIADIVGIRPRTVEAIRDDLKIKTNSKSMAGLLMFAHKSGILELETTLETNNALSDENVIPSLPEKSYELSKEQMIKLFGLSTAILSYLNHDLSGQKVLISYSLACIQEEIEKNKDGDNQDIEIISKNLKKAIHSADKISTILDSISSAFYKNTNDSDSDFKKLFVSNPFNIIAHIKGRYQDVNILIDPSSHNTIEIIYPPRLLLAILTELTENAYKSTANNLVLIVKWGIENSSFFCEFHDNGKGFTNIPGNQNIPFASIKSYTDGEHLGYGLGLIDRTIIDSGGCLYFSNSKMLKGACVYFEFPVFDYLKNK